MVELTQAHHDWVLDTLNVDPRVFTPPDADIEAPLDDPDFAKKPVVLMQVADLRKDFSNSVRAACGRAHEAMSQLASTAWMTMDPRGAAAILSKSAPPLTKEQQATLQRDVDEIKRAVDRLNDLHDDIEAAVDSYEAAVTELNALPDQLADPPPDDDAKDGVIDKSALQLDGDFREHLWDFVNQVTQMTWKLADLHLFAGTDWIKDAIKHDDTDKKIEAVHAELDQQRAAINKLIDATRQRALADAEHAVTIYGKKMEALKKQVETVQTEITLYRKDLESFSTTKKGADGKASLSKQAKEMLEAYNAIVDAAMASQAALHALSTKTLGPSAYQRFAAQMIPLGKPVTDDTRTGGASLFLKGNTVVRYDQPVAIVEALASGLEDVRLVYANAPKIDALYDSWSKAMLAAR